MPETASFREWKAKDAIEWFYGIGRLALAKLAESYSAVCRCKQNMRCALLETILQWPFRLPLVISATPTSSARSWRRPGRQMQIGFGERLVETAGNRGHAGLFVPA
jgi:hypothetical protein